eukprot:COSAG01_NODE_176_length_22957_cov_72.262096_6_plen_110_part_00
MLVPASSNSTSISGAVSPGETFSLKCFSSPPDSRRRLRTGRAETTTRQGGAAALLPASIQERCRYRGLASALLFLVEAQSPSADRETMAVAMLLSAVLAAGVGPKHNVL